MIKHGIWDSPKAGVSRCIAAKQSAGTANKNTWTPLHNCCSLMALRPSHERMHARASHVTDCITLALLLCSLVHNTVASAQLPASSSNAHLTPNLRDNSKVFTQHTFLRNTDLPLSHAALSGQRASVAREGRQDPAGSELRRNK